MRAKIVMTITTEIDLDSMTPEHSVQIDDMDGLSEISQDVTGAVLIGALRSVERGLRSKFPGAGRALDRSEEKTDD